MKNTLKEKKEYIKLIEGFIDDIVSKIYEPSLLREKETQGKIKEVIKFIRNNRGFIQEVLSLELEEGEYRKLLLFFEGMIVEGKVMKKS